jgi:hypothetical protein
LTMLGSNTLGDPSTLQASIAGGGIWFLQFQSHFQFQFHLFIYLFIFITNFHSSHS